MKKLICGLKAGNTSYYSGNTCHYPIQNTLTSHFLSKDLKIKMSFLSLYLTSTVTRNL